MAIAGAILAVGTSIYTISEAEKSKKEAREGIENFKRQDLVNPFANIGISTEKEDRLLDAGLSSQATSVEALRRGGTRAVLSGLPRVSEANILLSNLITDSIAEKSERRDFAIARGEFRNQELQELREREALQGFGQMLQTARQDTVTGVSNLVSGGLSLGSAINPETGGVNLGGGSQGVDGFVPPPTAAPSAATNSLFVDRTDQLLFPNINNPFGFNQNNASLFGSNPSIFNV